MSTKPLLTLKDYWQGRDTKYPLALSSEVRRNTELTTELVNRLLDLAVAAGVRIVRSPITGTVLSSGWRPPAVNAATPKAATRSHHIMGRAADIYDPDDAVDAWLMTVEGQSALKTLGLWMEHPSATKGWSHVQSKPPGSGNRVFYP